MHVIKDHPCLGVPIRFTGGSRSLYDTSSLFDRLDAPNLRGLSCWRREWENGPACYLSIRWRIDEMPPVFIRVTRGHSNCLSHMVQAISRILIQKGGPRSSGYRRGQPERYLAKRTSLPPEPAFASSFSFLRHRRWSKCVCVLSSSRRRRSIVGYG